MTGKPLFLVSTLPGLGNSYKLWRITGTTTPVLSNVSVLGSSTYSIPPNASQKGGGVLLDTNDNRVLHAAFRNGEVWAAHTTGCAIGAAPDESCVKLVRITPSDAGGTMTFERTYGLANQFIWMPAIAVNKNNDVGIAFQKGSKNVFLGSGMNGKRASATTTDTINVLKGGVCHYELVPPGASNRTGDYTGAQVDPVDDTSFWFAAEYGGKVTGFVSCLWRTRIVHTTY
jgi:hypothetical protein